MTGYLAVLMTIDSLDDNLASYTYDPEVCPPLKSSTCVRQRVE